MLSRWRSGADVQQLVSFTIPTRARNTRLAFGRTLREAGILGSIGRRGDAYDNAMAESFWSTIDRELLADSVFIDRASARMAIFEYIECWFVPWRRHSSLGMLSPVEFERQWRAKKPAEEVMA